MDIEFEATFANVDKEDVRKRLKQAGAELVREEGLMKRAVFAPPGSADVSKTWLRVRDEGEAITMSLKTVDGDKIEDQKEACVKIQDFDQGVALLEAVGASKKAYQETLRELWILDGVEVTIDTWPFLEPFVEVEGESERVVREVSEKLSFNYDEALFCSVTELYHCKYNISHDRISNQTPLIVFDMQNPFL